MGLFSRKDRNAVTTTTPAPVARPATASGTDKVNLRKAARVSLTKYPRAARRWAVYLVVDQSGSMSRYIPHDVNFLVDGLFAVVDEGGFDDDGIVPCVPFASRAAAPVEVAANDSNPSQAIADAGNRARIGGGTCYAYAINEVVRHYRASASYGRVPALVVFQTDGADGTFRQTAERLTEYSNEPIHWVFVHFGDPNGYDAESLRSLDEGSAMVGRRVDNVSVLYAGPRPRDIDPAKFYDGLLSGPNRWVQEAAAEGIHIPGSGS